ncbi:hypothetical protein [Mycolicibacterium psychrotolerans]|nr:hypothetical protein [Mycolicibacterium psychrotolerans]
MLHVPSRPPTVSRREVLVGMAVLAATAATAAGCGTPPPPPDLDDLTTALDRARADARLAGEAAATARGPVAQTLTQVAGQRSAHAAALSDEIVRLTGRPAPTSSVSVTTSTSVAAGVPPAPAPTSDDVIGSLRASADSAAHAAAALSGYRAGLLASIAASCTAAYTVALASRGGAR